jgi:acyl-CoA hydrolase
MIAARETCVITHVGSVDVRNPRSNESVATTSACFTMLAVDDAGTDTPFGRQQWEVGAVPEGHPRVFVRGGPRRRGQIRRDFPGPGP